MSTTASEAMAALATGRDQDKPTRAEGMETFALRVRTLMREREISLRRLAKTINYDPGYLSRVLNGHRPSSPAMAKLSRSLLGGNGALEECDRLLDQAERLIDRIDDPYPWGSACLTPHYLDVQRATCYVRLGADREALSLWNSILPTLPPGARRDKGVFRARQARAPAAW